MSLVEAEIYGKPMISCEIGTGTSFVNLDQETGFTISPDNPQVLATAMNHMIANPEQAAALGRNARNRYLNLFTSDRMCAEYVDLYNRIMK